MTPETAEARGRVVIRPWRLGVLIDTSSREQVRAAIANLSSVWGGRYMPILDIGTPLGELRALGEELDVDSLYTDVVEGPLGEFLREPGWGWQGRGPRGPFSDEAGIRHGLLPARVFVDDLTDFVQPTWDVESAEDLILAATWGVSDRMGIRLTADIMGPRVTPYERVLASPRTRGELVGALEVGGLHVRVAAGEQLDIWSGVHLVRPDVPRDIVDFWNLRARGVQVIAVPSEGADHLAELLLSSNLPAARHTAVARREDASRARLWMWGLEHASSAVAGLLEGIAERGDLDLAPTEAPEMEAIGFPGLETSFTHAIRADFRPEAHWVDVELPLAPVLRDDAEHGGLFPGVVGAEVEVRHLRGQDPRFTSSVPPYRRHSALVSRIPRIDGVEQVRVTGDGLVFGLQAHSESVRVPFPFNLDVMGVLFDDVTVSVKQSDVGRFQTRAAEKFGGPFSGVFNQPGVRAAVLQAGRDNGVTLNQLRTTVESQRGRWPDSLLQQPDPREYAERQVNYLLGSGLLVPTTRVHCSHCRVERYASADELASTMTCEFCGQAFSLALSHGLSEPQWRYRLAAHLRADQVKALLPALATASLLDQLRPWEEPTPAHVLGLEVTIAGRTVEADVAVYLREHDWALVLGEVKTGSRIDGNDVANIEFLADKLAVKGVRCLPLFATLKDQLSADEVADLRAMVERARPIRLARGDSVPRLPLVLTGPDLSHPPQSEEHPWRWDRKNYAGVFGTAITSCEKNLGLRQYRWEGTDSGRHLTVEWD